MKNSNITKNRTRVALLLVLAACITGLTPGLPASAEAYSINDVSGNYVLHGEGWSFGNGSVNYVPGSFVGLTTFTPATGAFHGDWLVRSNGETLHAVVDGTYTVDATGHGSMTWVSTSGNTSHNDFYIVNGGAELKAINTDPPGTAKASNFTTFTKQ
jgi:hypothetical protein